MEKFIKHDKEIRRLEILVKPDVKKNLSFIVININHLIYLYCATNQRKPKLFYTKDL